ncbi:MAG: hypothetical protein E7294_05255 [Lachnospiraceae bacterium]|nr:hypothetical protein [Lachnospiraceae bacterium]
MPFKVEYGDITTYSADAIVIPANPKATVGNGVDKLIYKLAGRNRMLEARRKIGEMDFGEVNFTDAFDLRRNGIKQIIHAVSPGYIDGKQGEAELLRACYEKSLQCAVDNGCRSIVFPLLSTGVLNYPVDQARNIAEGVCNLFSAENDIDITLVIYDGQKESPEDTEALYRYIEENTYGNLSQDQYNRAEREWSHYPKEREERMILDLMRKQIARKKADERAYRAFLERHKPKKKEEPDFSRAFYMMDFITTIKSFDSYINEPKKPTFNEVFEKFRAAKKAGKYREICVKANLREDTLSKLRSGTTNPARDYIWALAVALKLDLDETEELFNSCGLSIHGGFRFQDGEEQRERAIEFGLINHWGIKTVNDKLESMNMLRLGNFVA